MKKLKKYRDSPLKESGGRQKPTTNQRTHFRNASKRLNGSIVPPEEGIKIVQLHEVEGLDFEKMAEHGLDGPLKPL